MKQRWNNRLLSMILAMILIMGSAAVLKPSEVLAASVVPGKETFILRDDLFQFGCGNNRTYQKVYFGLNGTNPQGWYIAGHDKITGGLVLICDPLQPMNTNQIFDSSTTEKYYTNAKGWGTYNNDYSFTGYIYQNHYGASKVRKDLQTYASERFSAVERNMMKNTQLYVADSKNKKTYWVMDQLYLPASKSYPSNHVYVGGSPASGTENDMSGSIGILTYLSVWTNDSGSPYDLGTGKKFRFWLRNPGNNANQVVAGYTGADNVNTGITSPWPLLPAFCLDVSNVEFASAAKSGSSSASLDASNGMTLRCTASSSQISSSAEYTSKKVTVKKGSESGKIYLYIQGCDNGTDFVYSKEISGDTQVSAADVRSSATDLSQCKIWLETVIDRVAFAKMAEKSSVVEPEEPSGPTTPSDQNSNGTQVSPLGNLTTLEGQVTALSENGDPAGSAFSILQLKAKKVKKTSITIGWKAVPGAAGYVIYAAPCGTRYSKLTDVAGTSFTQSGLKKGKYYKYFVAAHDRNGNILASSKTVHIATSGGKKGNTKSVRLNKKKATLKKGKTVKLKATLKNGTLKVSKHRKVAYETDNPNVATVTKSGKVKAVGKGRCTIYAYAQNGVFAKCKITVK